MNESEKNIETCLPESILAEVASVPTDPQFVSLVNESLDPLQQQAVQQAGSDAYNEVVASHQPYTFTSSVRQMKSNLILLLRRFWRFHFGSGTIRSLSDMWAHYINRLQGSETYGIPSRLDQLTDLPSAPLLVADRKISGVPEAEDGMSVAQLACSDLRSQITELTDDTEGWTFKSDAIFNIFPALKNVKLGCSDVYGTLLNNRTLFENFSTPHLHLLDGNARNIIYASNSLLMQKVVIKAIEEIRTIGAAYRVVIMQSNSVVEELEVQDLKKVYRDTSSYTYDVFGIIAKDCSSLKKINLVDVEVWDAGPMASNTPNLEEILMAKSRYIKCRSWGGLCSTNQGSYPKVWKIVFGTLEYYDNAALSFGTSKLRHLEIGVGTAISLNFANWTPDSETLAHQDFLQNFRSFIVLRLANRKSTTALTLTLSANVYNAVTGANSGWASQHTLADLGITDNDLTDLETELGITSATIYATWLDTYTGANGIHWDINKAN